jgi:predicted Zn-dependent peptidase
MHKIKKLKNGLRIINLPMPAAKTATVLVMVGTGSKYETKANNGISHFLEHMFFKGTKKRPAAKIIASEFDAIGGIYNAFTGKECTGYWAKVSSEKLPLAIDIIGDIFLNSKLAEEEISKERGVIIEEINMYQDTPLLYLEDVFEKCLYGDQPAGWETIGPKKNILRFKRSDFLNYFNSQYGPKNVVVCIAGGARKNIKLVEGIFSSKKQSAVNKKIAVKEKQVAPRVLSFFKKTDQAHISLGVRTFGSGHKDEFIVKVMADILGGSMSSRLFSELREKRGLAYYVKTEAEFYTDSGYLTTSAGVPVGRIEEAIRVIMAEYKKIKEKLIAKSELKRVKEMIKGRMAIGLEASDSIAIWHARQVIFKNKVITPEEYLKKICNVNSIDINRVAQKIFIEKKLNLAIIGPYKDGKKFIKTLKV